MLKIIHILSLFWFLKYVWCVKLQNLALKLRQLQVESTTLSSCIQWTNQISSGSKYCRNPLSNNNGYCWSSSDTNEFWTVSQNITCNDNATLFPGDMKYALCKTSQTSSYCGVSDSTEITIQNGINSRIVALSIVNQEFWLYEIKIDDELAQKFTISVIASSNVNVTIARFNSDTLGFENSQSLSTGDTHVQNVTNGEIYKIIAIPSIDNSINGTLALLIESPATKSDSDNSSLSIYGILTIVGLAVLIIWIILWFGIIFYCCWCIKPRTNESAYQNVTKTESSSIQKISKNDLKRAQKYMIENGIVDENLETELK